MDWNDYIDKSCKAIEIDEKCQNEEIMSFWKNPVDVRVRTGRTIKNVRFDTCVGNICYFSTTQPTGQYRIGDSVVITPQKIKHPSSSSRKGTIIDLYFVPKQNLTKILVEVDYPIFEKGEEYIFDESTKDFSKIIKKVLSACKKRKTLQRIINGTQTKEDNFLVSLHKEWETYCDDLDESQKEAIKNCLQLKQWGFYYVQGPPGTGKTVTLARLACLLAKRGSVGMIAFTNRAINKFVKETYDYIKKKKLKVNLLRVAAEYQLKELPNEIKINTFPLEIVEGTIYAATIHKFAHSYKQFDDEHSKFDWLIFDEAGQISIPYIIASMYFGKRFIFFGDHQQLSPVVSLEENEDNKEYVKLLKTSVLQHLVEKYKENSLFKTMLTTTYRLNHELAEFPNKKFYFGCIKVANKTEPDKEKIYVSGDTFIDKVINCDKSEIFLELPPISEVSFSAGINYAEVSLVVELCKRLINFYKNKGYDEETIVTEKIGVVSPYRNQCNEINKRLNFYNLCLADTVERFQGQQRDVMIISYARVTLPNDPRIDFIYNPNRFNVAITRARKKNIIVGSSRLFLNGTELFREYYLRLRNKGQVVLVKEDELLKIIKPESLIPTGVIYERPTVVLEGVRCLVADKYELLREIHRSNMSIMYLAKDISNGELVVLKKLSEMLSMNLNFRERFKKEKSILQFIKNIPGVVHLYNEGLVTDNENNFYLVLEYVCGRSLEYIINTKKIHWKETIKIVKNLACILQLLHDKGIVHLDIKSSNVIVTDTGEIKLTDFGIAQFFDENIYLAEQILGTPEYMSPEQHIGKKLDHRSDIYSLGILFYELLTGRLPFCAKENMNFLELKKKKDYIPVTQVCQEIPKEVDKIISKCLEPEPDKRYQSAVELIKDLNKLGI